MKLMISETELGEVVAGASLQSESKHPWAVAKPGDRQLGEKGPRKGRNGMKIRGVDKITRTR
jgi:hypothetical protein